jgi:hypothetical protein
VGIDEKVAFDLDDLPLDVFELADRGLEVESLTADHGMDGVGASSEATSTSGGIAGRLLARYPESEGVVMVVTDGEPTAHLLRDGTPSFSWPPMPETLELTLAEVDRLTRAGVTINVFMLDDEPRLVQFVEEGPGATAGGCSRPTRVRSASTSSATTCVPKPAAAPAPPADLLHSRSRWRVTHFGVTGSRVRCPGSTPAAIAPCKASTLLLVVRMSACST